jgi:hypothetical protein
MAAPQSNHQAVRAALVEIYAILRCAALRARESQPADEQIEAADAGTSTASETSQP